MFATLIFLGLILVRSFFPPQEQEIADAGLAADANSTELVDPAVQDQDPDSDSDSDSDSSTSSDSTDNNSSTESNSDTNENAPTVTSKFDFDQLQPQEFFTIGQLDSSGSHKNLVTLSSRGGTVRRVELNDRRKNGNLLYRDLEYEAAYIGQLELTSPNSNNGATINVVGPGTPAQLAGLQVGDVINSVDNEPVGSPEQFYELLANIKAGESIGLGFSRDGNNQSATIESTRAPLQVILPISEELELAGPAALNSFQVTLNYPDSVNDWPEIDQALRFGNWDAEVVSENEVRFKKTVSKALLNKFGLDGPLEIIKTFRAISRDSAGIESDIHANHFMMDIELRNLAAEAQKLNLQLVGPTGTTTEGWWYQNKIHGRQTALFYTAGARDVIVGRSGDDYSFWGGPEIIKAADSNEFVSVIDPIYAASERRLTYAAVDTQYFAVAMMPVADQATPIEYFKGFAVPASIIPKNKKEQRKTDITFRLFSEPILLEPAGEGGTSFTQSFKIFAGPKEASTLQAYGLEDCRTFGWFDVFSRPLIWLLGVFYSIIPNYGLAIILMTFLVRLIMMPISRKAARNALMMQYLQPEIKKIAEKYKEDFQKRGQAQQALMAKHNVRPLGGCLLMFIQLPIFIGLYRGISVDMGLRDKALIPGLDWCNNLAGPDQLFYWGDLGMPFLFAESGWLGPFFNILPIITVVLFLVQQKLFTPPATDDQQRMMQKMMKFMMLFMGVLFFKVSSGLCIYFITSSLWGILERKFIPKPELPQNLKDQQQNRDQTSSGSSVSASDGKNGSVAYNNENDKLKEKRRADKERRKRKNR